jgi:hypothetical protein
MKLIVTFRSSANAPKKGHKEEGACWLLGVLQIVVMVRVMGVEHGKARQRKQSYTEASKYIKVNISF